MNIGLRLAKALDQFCGFSNSQTNRPAMTGNTIQVTDGITSVVVGALMPPKHGPTFRYKSYQMWLMDLAAGRIFKRRIAPTPAHSGCEAMSQNQTDFWRETEHTFERVFNDPHRQAVTLSPDQLVKIGTLAQKAGSDFVVLHFPLSTRGKLKATEEQGAPIGFTMLGIEGKGTTAKKFLVGGVTPAMRPILKSWLKDSIGQPGWIDKPETIHLTFVRDGIPKDGQ